jgi:hypothetical protein
MARPAGPGTLGSPHSDTPRRPPCRDPLYQLADRVTTHFPDLPRATAFVLALWAFGMDLAHARALSAVALPARSRPTGDFRLRFGPTQLG